MKRRDKIVLKQAMNLPRHHSLMMLDALLPTENSSAAGIVRLITQFAAASGTSETEPWSGRYAQMYGSFQSQRKLDIEDLAGTIAVCGNSGSLSDLILALETYYVFTCTILAITCLETNPEIFLLHLAALPFAKLQQFLVSLFTGQEYKKRGVISLPHAEDYGWFVPFINDGRLFSEWFQVLKTVFDKAALTAGADGLQHLHCRLFPKNLLHTSGQFYTPDWLAELLLEDVGWTSGQSLVDPFCGSGVFLIAAIQRARGLGESPIHLLPDLLGLDISPSACAASVAAMTMNLQAEIRESVAPVTLNVLSADVISSAMVQSSQQHSLGQKHVLVDGNLIMLDEHDLKGVDGAVRRLAEYDIKLPRWIKSRSYEKPISEVNTVVDQISTLRMCGQIASMHVEAADLVLTNPPWVGWEYIPRQYRTYIDPAWRIYDLFTARGREAAFLKEDLSTLALAVAWDRFLASGGKSGVVIRPATMRSDLAGKGTRRLSIFPQRGRLQLTHIREFQKLKTFVGAAADAATWQIVKDKPTVFPVPVTTWTRRVPGGIQPSNGSSAEHVRSNVEIEHAFAQPTNSDDWSSRWSVMGVHTLSATRHLGGSNSYQPRLGIFTGGANGVFYLLPLGQQSNCNVGTYVNVVERARRIVPETNMRLEKELVFSVVRGRDLDFWKAQPQQSILCTHSLDTRMYPIPEDVMRDSYPLAFEYLSSMRSILSVRGGFSGWEQNIASSAFYALQRIGTYTFAPYKVCWKYIASEFIVSVVGPDDSGRPRIPNDKVIFIPFDNEAAAYWLAGLLSSTLISKMVSCSVSNRQISASAIKNISLPQFDSNDQLHLQISELCRQGHRYACLGDTREVAETRKALDECVATVYSQREQRETS